jgi:hypothetical protein
MLASILASILPTFLLNGLKAWLTAYTSAEQTKREVALATISGIVAARQAQASVIETGMGHKAFWVPWTIAAVSAAGWYAWGMVDSAWPGHLPHVAALPPQLLDLTSRIWDNLFLSGSIAVGGTNIAKAIRALVK